MNKTLGEIQSEVYWWSQRNFPDNTSYMCLLGVVEEVGELSHAHLKQVQGIRKPVKSSWEADKQDAVGDILIYLLDYCGRSGFDMEDILNQTWDKVSKRDWTNKKETGV